MLSPRAWKSQAAGKVINLLPKRVQLATLYRKVNGAPPDLRSPRLLSEKILHRILTDRDPLLKVFCDKVAAKEWIKARLGPGHTPPTLAVVDSVDALQTLDLPERWMLKPSHGSGWYRLVDTAHPLDAAALEQARRWLSTDYAGTFQEWGYKDLPRRLMAEELLTYAGGQCTEVSAFCFHGRVRALRLFRKGPPPGALPGSPAPPSRSKECFLDETLYPLPVVRPHHDHCPELADADPQQIAAFLALTGELSSAMPFVRVDGYLSDKGPLVGELTPYPGAGVMYQLPRQWDAWFGAFWD